jgi:hypothetical protein
MKKIKIDEIVALVKVLRAKRVKIHLCRAVAE